MYTHLAWFCMKSWEEKDLGESLTLDIRMWHVSFDQSQWSILIFRISSKSIYSFDYKIQSDLPKVCCSVECLLHFTDNFTFCEGYSIQSIILVVSISFSYCS